MSKSVAGRDAELASIRDFVATIPDGPAALVLGGEAGVGKTTLWAAAIEAAEERGLRVLQARPAESETALSFSGIGDLLDRVLDEALAPPAPGQRRALSRALVLDDDEGPPPDPHAVGLAVLNAVRGLPARGRPFSRSTTCSGSTGRRPERSPTRRDASRTNVSGFFSHAGARSRAGSRASYDGHFPQTASPS